MILKTHYPLLTYQSLTQQHDTPLSPEIPPSLLPSPSVGSESMEDGRIEREVISLEAQDGHETEQLGEVDPERSRHALELLQPARTGVKAPQRQRLREMKTTPVGSYKYANAEGFNYGGILLSTNKSETSDKIMSHFDKSSYCR